MIPVKIGPAISINKTSKIKPADIICLILSVFSISNYNSLVNYIYPYLT